MNQGCCPIWVLLKRWIRTYRIDKVVGEDPKVDTDMEDREPDNKSHDSCANLYKNHKLNFNELTKKTKRYQEMYQTVSLSHSGHTLNSKKKKAKKTMNPSHKNCLYPLDSKVKM